MKPDTVNFVVCSGLGVGKWVAVDTEDVVFADVSVCDRVEVKCWRVWHLGALPARAA